MPGSAWRTDPLWREGACVIGLRNLAADECARLLAARGIDAACHARLIEISHGHPLALTLLADVVAGSGELPSELGRDLVRELATRFGEQAPTDLHRRALEVCAHARVTTETLLADVLDAERARELFDWLASLERRRERAPGPVRTTWCATRSTTSCAGAIRSGTASCTSACGSI